VAAKQKQQPSGLFSIFTKDLSAKSKNNPELTAE
jgi:hypothetical protein